MDINLESSDPRNRAAIELCFEGVDPIEFAGVQIILCCDGFLEIAAWASCDLTITEKSVREDFLRARKVFDYFQSISPHFCEKATSLPKRWIVISGWAYKGRYLVCTLDDNRLIWTVEPNPD